MTLEIFRKKRERKSSRTKILKVLELEEYGKEMYDLPNDGRRSLGYFVIINQERLVIKIVSNLEENRTTCKPRYDWKM